MGLFSVFPLPVQNFWHVDPVFVNVLFVLDELVAYKLFEVATDWHQLRHAVDHVTREVKTVEIIQHRHVERRGGGAFFFVSAHVKVVMIVAAISRAGESARDIRDKRKSPAYRR